MPVLAEPELLIVETPEQAQPGGPGGGGPPVFETGGGGNGDDDDYARRQPRAGTSAGLLGVCLLMFSITALFGTVILAFVSRSHSSSHWDPVPAPSFLWVSTGVILVSSLVLEKARSAFRRLDAGAYGRWLVAAFFLGLAFVVSQALAVRQLAIHGLFLRSNPHSSLFYLITALHGVHVFGGLLGLFYLVVRASLRTDDLRTDFKLRENAVRVTTAYWHFLGLLWLALFLLLLLWQ